jgi:predicted metal-dependent HD superfamily phosphohydrolase
MEISELLTKVRFYKLSRVVNTSIRQAFAGYVALYHNGDKEYDSHIQLKHEHTRRVCEEIRSLGESLGMNTEELDFVEVLGWLHDIGRFEQYDRYATFADAESENHARISLRVIQKLGLLKDLDQEKKEIIRQAILNHNLPRLPGINSPEVDFYSRLLRDADKLDIWRVSLEYNIFHRIKTGSFPDTYKVPGDLLKCFEEERIIFLDQVDSFYDSILFRMSWIYDLSFPHTFRRVKERGILQGLAAKLPASGDVENIVARANAYINTHAS